MVGGGKYILAALAGMAALFTVFQLGLIIGAFYETQPDNFPAYIIHNQASPSTSATAPDQSREYKVPCSVVVGKDESELCAQWRAAEASEKSAFWSMIGVGATLAGIVGLVANIMQGRASLERASEANQITRDALEAELRPWLTITDLPDFRIGVGVYGDGRPSLSLSGHVEVENIGQAPALDVIIMMPGLQGITMLDDWPKFDEAIARIYRLEDRYASCLAPSQKENRPIMHFAPRDEMIAPWHLESGVTVYPAGTFRVAACYRSRVNGGIHVTKQEWVVAKEFYGGGMGRFGAENWHNHDFSYIPFPQDFRLGRTVDMT